MKFIKHPFLLGLVTLVAAGGADAALLDRGNGLVYDSGLNITWLQDANLAQTLGQDSDGRLSWADANTWAEHLSFAGFDNWRLPALTSSNLCVGSNCSNSELAHLYYGELGGVAEQSLSSHHNSNYGLFSQIKDAVYWLRDQQILVPGYVLGWGVVTGDGVLSGYQGLFSPNSEFYAWAVHDGDIGEQVGGAPGAVPLPGASLLFAAGLVVVARASKCLRAHG